MRSRSRRSPRATLASGTAAGRTPRSGRPRGRSSREPAVREARAPIAGGDVSSCQLLLELRDVPPHRGERLLRVPDRAEPAWRYAEETLGATTAFRGRAAEVRGHQTILFKAFQRGIGGAE